MPTRVVLPDNKRGQTPFFSLGEKMHDTIAKVRKFRDDRDWQRFHDPKSLAASICIEAAELLELFQWLAPDEARREAAAKRERVAEEIADVAIYLIELADVTGIDLAAAIEAKLEKNAVKYPIS